MHCSFDATKNRLDYYKGKYCMKNVCLDLKEHVTKIINYEKYQMISLTRKEEKKHNKQEVCYICKKGFSTDDDYHFIIKELAEEFQGEFECLGENTEKYITFSVPIKKEITKVDQDGFDKIMKISCKIKSVDRFRFMSSSLSSLVDNLSDGPHSDKCTDCKSCLDYMITKDDQLILRCFECKNNYEKEFANESIKRFANIYEFCNGDVNKFILLLRKGVHPYEYIGSWERFDETSLPDKAFYSSLNMEDIADLDHRYAKRVFKSFNNKNVGYYHDLYVQSDTLLLAAVFENFRNMCNKVYELGPAHF